MAFMQQQITDKRKWLEIDGDNGTTFVDAADAPDLLAAVEAPEGTEMEELPEDIAESYYDGKIVNDVHVREGHGARLSAPGFMDRTDWDVFDTPEQAKAYLDSEYGDENEEIED